MRIGYGYDAHRFVHHRPLVIGGIVIPYSYGLLGHSDADVLTHAMMDALLGALALGSIGDHFPDTDPAYKDASSTDLLVEVMGLVHKKGYGVGNIDSVLVAEMPKFFSYIVAIRENLACVMQIDIDRVSVKATTTEKMGFEGRQEGISAHAVVLLERK